MRTQSWLVMMMMVSVNVFGQARDPGPRAGAPAAGGPLAGLTTEEAARFDVTKDIFGEVPTVTDVGDDDHGLGPRFNGTSCFSCHSQPSAGGSSPAVNPQIEAATAEGAQNTVPFFLSLDGPVREVRFRYQLTPDGSRTRLRDGGVHALFVVTGRRDAAGCKIKQPDFVAAARVRNLSFRIPTPTFGAGLLEAITDGAILSSHQSTRSARARLGIDGHPNHNGNDGTIARFGWKAQNKSLLLFAGEAYNVEMGVTNEIFPQERDETAGCRLNPLPEDGTVDSDMQKFAFFMRTTAPPARGPITASVQRGERTFHTVGCVLCHTAALPIESSALAAIANQKSAALYSDLLVHRMGARLADDIQQGEAGPDEFRTAPLWGLGQRLFFLHDGRTNDLRRAVEWHASDGSFSFAASEANGVIRRYLRLGETEKQDLFDFLRSL